MNKIENVFCSSLSVVALHAKRLTPFSDAQHTAWLFLDYTQIKDSVTEVHISPQESLHET